LTLNDFRTRISAIIGLDTNSDGSEVDLIDAWVFEATVDFLAKTKSHKRLISMACTVDETEYTLDSDAIAIDKLWFSPADGSQAYMMEPIPTGELLERRMIGATDSDTPRFFSLEGSNLLFIYPAAASTADTIQGVYVPMPTAMSATANSLASTAYGGIPVEFHPIVLDYVLWKAADYDDDQSSQIGLQYQAQYEKGVAWARGQMMRKAGIRLPEIRPGRPRRRWPVSPGVDLGY
jgi:hypothetical protein